VNSQILGVSVRSTLTPKIWEPFTEIPVSQEL